MKQAFILGAGLGTRLRPLTNRLPKPLVPLFHKPLAQWAMEACLREGVERFAVNTHHLPEAWRDFGEEAIGRRGIVGGNGEPAIRRVWQGCEVDLFHEPVLLDTGGGLKNIEAWIGNEATLVHNGDIFTTMPLRRLIDAHEAGGLPVTLALRSEGKEKRVGVNAAADRVTDMRHALGVDAGTHVFSGVYCVNAEFLSEIPAGEIVSVVPAFLELVKRGELGCVVIDDGVWLDLGDRESYLHAHRELALDVAVHPGAEVAETAQVDGSVIGAGAKIGQGARVSRSVVWPGAQVADGAVLDECIVLGHAEGVHTGEDL